MIHSRGISRDIHFRLKPQATSANFCLVCDRPYLDQAVVDPIYRVKVRSSSMPREVYLHPAGVLFFWLCLLHAGIVGAGCHIQRDRKRQQTTTSCKSHPCFYVDDTGTRASRVKLQNETGACWFQEGNINIRGHPHTHTRATPSNRVATPRTSRACNPTSHSSTPSRIRTGIRTGTCNARTSGAWVLSVCCRNPSSLHVGNANSARLPRFHIRGHLVSSYKV